MLTLTRCLPADPNAAVCLTLNLDAAERMRSRHRFQTPDGQAIYLRLPRGSVLKAGDLLQSDAGDALVRVAAKPETVMVVTAATPYLLLQAAYHLGNRHVSLEITETSLRLEPDPVLKVMLEQLGLQVSEAILSFHPEAGAYGHHHNQGG